MTRLLARFLLILIGLSSYCFAQLGPTIWDEAKKEFAKHASYKVEFSFDRSSPMTRSAPAKGSMTYSEGKFKLTLPDLSWYFNGDTLWEQVDGRYNVEIRLGLDPKALSPSEMLEVLNRQPASVKHYGIMDHNGEMCDRLKIDFSGKSLPYETVFLWVNTKRQIVKVLFMDQHQVATTIVLHSIKPIPTPNPLTFSFR